MTVSVITPTRLLPDRLSMLVNLNSKAYQNNECVVETRLFVLMPSGESPAKANPQVHPQSSRQSGPIGQARSDAILAPGDCPSGLESQVPMTDDVALIHTH